MRKVLPLFLLLFSTSAFASGKLTFQPNYWFQGNNRFTPTVGLAVYEKLTESVALNAWAGLGNAPISRSELVNWSTLKTDFDYKLKGGALVSSGVQVNYLTETREVIPNVHFKLSLPLW